MLGPKLHILVTPNESSDPLPFAQATHAQIRELQAALGAEHGLAEGSTLGTASGPGQGVKELYIFDQDDGSILEWHVC